MQNSYYAIYVNDIIAFSRTLVIKFSDVADTVNQALRDIGYTVDETQPQTWRYYQHLAGVYHPMDTEMTVRSVDTLETIAFTKENLAIHRATAREYRPGTRYYNDLIQRYPNQADLIHGIITPVDIDIAIAAAEGDILGYDATYIGTNETNLITNLQGWIHRYVGRWHNRQYCLADTLYLPAFLGTFYLQLPNVIQTLRLENAKTQYAHHFHIRSYLASNGGLDRFMPYMTTKQQLWLYRNIRYLRRHVGQQQIFDLLVDNLLTPRGIPLAEYRLRHNVEELPESLYPSVEMWKYPINFGYNQTGIDVSTVYTILDKERGLARFNGDVQETTETTIIENVQSGAESTLPTKVLESEVIDRSNSGVRSVESVLINEWTYLATHGRYTTYVNIPNPGTGEYLNVSAHDALMIAFYAFWKARGITYDTFPSLIAYDVLRDPLPTTLELRKFAPRHYISDDFVAALTDRITPLGEYITVDDFHQACRQLHQEYIDGWRLYSFQEHMKIRGYAEQLFRRHFMHVRCPLTETPVNPEVWLTDKGYGIADLDTLNLEQLYTDAVNAATGLDTANPQSLKAVQNAMLELMGELTSYSIQFLRTVNISDYLYTAVPATRVGDIKGSTRVSYQAPTPTINVRDMRGHRHGAYALPENAIAPTYRLTAVRHHSFRYDPSVGYRLRPRVLGRVAVGVGDVGVRRATSTVHYQTPTQPLGQYQYPADGDDWPNAHDD